MDQDWEPEVTLVSRGLREWERLEQRPADRVALEIHRRYLERFIRPRDCVLDAGAGPGRFTIELGRLGARVTVGDISPRQLELNAAKVSAAGYESAVEERVVLDITDLRRFPDPFFDATVCYGGAISYVIERADEAVSELLRVAKPGGHLLLSVMSLIGSMRFVLPSILEEAARLGLDRVQRTYETGDLDAEQSGGQPMRLYRWETLRELLTRHPCQLVSASASNYLSLGHDEALERISEEYWRVVLDWEFEACAQSGAIDGGQHMLVAVRRR